MKTPDRLPLLDALSRDEESIHAPSLASVLALARDARRRRARRRTGALASAAVLAITGLWFARFAESRRTTVPAAVASVRQPLPAPVAARVSPIERVSDQELLDLLGNTPAALVHLPDGRQRLMLLVVARPAHR